LLSQDETVETLVNLGLTVLQARVYIALSRLGTQTGRATAKAARVAPQDVYRVLSELQEKGLIEKIISKPNQYRSAPVIQGLSMLLHDRNQQTYKLKKAVSKICKNLEIKDYQDNNDVTKEFALLPAQERAINRDVNLFETVQTSLELVNNFQESMALHEYHFKREIKALKTGVKIREILSVNNSRIRPSNDFLKLVAMKPAYRVRYIYSPEPAKLIIKDSKEVLVSTKGSVNALQQPVLWSSNNVLVQIIQQWFDNMWKNSQEEYLCIEA
jgi:sugar-specific transcriptional regulator TrmB